MLLLMLFPTLFNTVKCVCSVLLLLALASCSGGEPAKHRPRPIQKIEVMMQERANQGVPLLLEWVFVEDPKAYEAIVAMKAAEFLESE